MAWFKVDDTFYRHRKVRKLGKAKVTVSSQVAAVGLWTLAGTWAADNLTDGFVPWEVIEGWDPQRQLAGRLLGVGMWNEAEQDDEAGIRFHDWADYQPSARQIEAERVNNNRRAALSRDITLLRAIRDRDGDRCRYCGCLVNWKDRRGATGGTYDHVDAQGDNTLDNVVVACRACNARKGNRPLDQSGMTLLPPGSLGSDLDPVGSDLDPSRKRPAAKAGPTKLRTKNGSSTRPEPEPDPGSVDGRPGEGSSGSQRAREERPPTPKNPVQGTDPVSFSQLGDRPPDRCPKHVEVTEPPPCGPCADARRAAERWDTAAEERRQRVAAELTEGRADPANRCTHGTDGGLLVHPDTGESLCSLCRAETRSAAS